MKGLTKYRWRRFAAQSFDQGGASQETQPSWEPALSETTAPDDEASFFWGPIAWESSNSIAWYDVVEYSIWAVSMNWGSLKTIGLL